MSTSRRQRDPDDLDDTRPAVTDPSDADVTDDEPEVDEGCEHRQFVVGRDVRKRIDVYLQMRLKGFSRSRARKLIEWGGVTLNGKPPKPSATVRQGDVIDVILPPPAVRTIDPEPIPLEILYEDEHFVVVNKQADLIVHPARGNLSGTLINGLAWHFQQQEQPQDKAHAQADRRAPRGAGSPDAETDEEADLDGRVDGLSSVGAEECRPGVVHRLDRNTTGVMVVAKQDEAHWLLGRQFQQRVPLKAYLAVVHGSPDGPGGVIDQPLGKHPTIREAYAVRHDATGRESVTLYRVRERYEGYALVELELRTGRTHQIRVHLQYLGWPIVGDIIYGGEIVGQREIDDPPIPAGSRRHLTFAREKSEGQRLEAEAEERRQRGEFVQAIPALHAALLRINHPIHGVPMTFTAPLHEPMATLVRRLRERPAEGPVATEGIHVDLDAAVPG